MAEMAATAPSATFPTFPLSDSDDDQEPTPHKAHEVPPGSRVWIGCPGPGLGRHAARWSLRRIRTCSLPHLPQRAAVTGSRGFAARAGRRLQLRRRVGARNAHTPKRAAARGYHGGAAGRQHRAQPPQSTCCGAGAPPPLGGSVLPRAFAHGELPASTHELLAPTQPRRLTQSSVKGLSCGLVCCPQHATWTDRRARRAIQISDASILTALPPLLCLSHVVCPTCWGPTVGSHTCTRESSLSPSFVCICWQAS
jgi:hypothetical protein